MLDGHREMATGSPAHAAVSNCLSMTLGLVYERLRRYLLIEDDPEDALLIKLAYERLQIDCLRGCV